jgi:transcriptional regulator with XRE-family HTH domain
VRQQNTLLRKLRRDREWSLDLTAAKSGINVSTLSRVERSLIPASEDVKKRLERLFKRPADELLNPPAEAA